MLKIRRPDPSVTIGPVTPRGQVRSNFMQPLQTPSSSTSAMTAAGVDPNNPDEVRAYQNNVQQRTLQNAPATRKR